MKSLSGENENGIKLFKGYLVFTHKGIIGLNKNGVKRAIFGVGLEFLGIVSSLCKYFSLDHEAFSSEVPGNDIKTLYSNILNSSGKKSAKNNDEVMRWIVFAESFPKDSKASYGVLSELNADLAPKSVLLGNGFTPSEADVIVFSAVHSAVIGFLNSEKDKLPHVIR